MTGVEAFHWIGLNFHFTGFDFSPDMTNIREMAISLLALLIYLGRGLRS